MSFHAILAVWDSLEFLLDGVEIDRGRNRVTVIRHLKGRRSRPLSDFAQLLIDRIDEGHYTLSLAGPSGAFHLLPFRTYFDTRHTAERIATHVGFDIRDEALGPRILIRRQRVEVSGYRDEHSAEHALPAGANETAALLVRRSESHADMLRIDHDEDPRKSAMIAIALAVLSATMVAVAWFFQALMPVAAIAAAISVAGTTLWILYRRRGVIFVRDADWFIAWRFLRTTRFTQLLPLSDYSEVILHAEERFRDNEDVNPYADRSEGTLSYAICLDGQTEPLEIRLASDLTQARKLAASVANFVALEFRDFTK